MTLEQVIYGPAVQVPSVPTKRNAVTGVEVGEGVFVNTDVGGTGVVTIGVDVFVARDVGVAVGPLT